MDGAFYVRAGMQMLRQAAYALDAAPQFDEHGFGLINGGERAGLEDAAVPVAKLLAALCVPAIAQPESASSRGA